MYYEELYSDKQKFFKNGLKILRIQELGLEKKSQQRSSIICTFKEYIRGDEGYFPIVRSQHSFDKLKNVVRKDSTNYSLYPNSITQTSTVKDSTTNLIDLTTKIVTTFTGPSTGLTPYLPAKITTTRTQNNQSASRVTDYAYEYAASPNIYRITKSTETTDMGDTNQVVTTYSNPDEWGHMQSISVVANAKTRSSSILYKPSGRFIASKTNALNETTNYNWDETFGLLYSETTKVGTKDRTTIYNYNSWGQLVETAYPTGIRTANVLQWNTDSSAKYFSYSETSGNAPVWVYYDGLGREVRKETIGLGNKKISVFTEYKPDGKVYQVSEPTFNTSAETWESTYTYDPTYGYLSAVTSPIGTSYTVYDKLKTTVTTPEGTSETITNAAGQTMSSNVNGKTVSFTYFPSGLTKTSTPEGGQALTMDYDLQGHRTYLKDPDAGEVFSTYNGFGELTEEKQKMRNLTDFIITTNTYDDNGLLQNIDRNGEITTYTYDTSIKSRVNSIEITGKNKQVFGFDDFNRVNKLTEDITANGVTRTYISGKEYDVFGRIKKEIYPSGYFNVNIYDKYSNLTEVKDNSNRSIWKANTENALGQTTSIFKGGKETTYTYDPVNHQTTSIYAAGVIDYSYSYYAADNTNHANNLEWRSDGITNQSEHFVYDPQNRLTNWDVTRGGTTTYNSMGFDGNGNISQKSDLGAFTLNYGGENPNGTTTGRPDGSLIGPHALSAISGVPASFPQVELPAYPTAELSVTYTDFKKIATLKEKNNDYYLTYGVDDQRRMSVYKVSDVTKLTRYYLGDYEEEIGADSKVRKIHYLCGAILIQNEGKADSLLYTYSDNQGSLIALTDVNGGIVRRYAYDPWGSRRDADNWNVKDNCTNLIINRGYTGHEHLDAFGIINMNGRVYDPLTAQFFSPDPFVQAPGNWVNYNRYGYCMGNPFAYTDPSGYSWLSRNWKPIVTTAAGIGVFVGVTLITGGIGAAPALALASGMTAATASSITGAVLGTALNGGSFGDCLIAGTKGGIYGGASAMATAGIGNIFGNVGGIGHEILRAGAHATAQGGISELSGGDFWQGAAAGAFGSLGGSAFQAYGGVLKDNALGVIGFSALSGGIGAELSGGNFWQGASTGAVIGLLNHSQVHNKKIAKPTVTTKRHNPTNTLICEIDIYGSQTEQGSSNAEIIIDAKTGMPEAEATLDYKVIKNTRGNDGSWSIGVDGLSVGRDGLLFTIDASFRNAAGTGGGITVKMTPPQLLLNAALIATPSIRIIQYFRTAVSF